MGPVERARLHAATVTTAGLVTAVVLVGWATGHLELTSFGLPASTTPWSAVGLLLVTLAGAVTGRRRAAVLAAATLVAVSALLVPGFALAAQDLLLPGVGAVSSPGTAIITLLAVTAAGLHERAEITASALLVSAMSLAVLALVGAFAGWTWAVSAGATDIAAGMGVPTVLLFAAAVVSVSLTPRRTPRTSWLLRRTGVWTMVAAATVPWAVVAVASDLARARHLAAAALTTAVVLVVSRTVGAEGEHTIEALFDIAPDPMLLIDADGTIVRANEQLASLCRVPVGRLVGMPVDSLVPVRARAAHRQRWESFRSSGGSRRMGEGAQVELARPDGTTVPVETSLAQVSVGGRLMVVGTVRDATAHRESVAALVRLESMRRLFLSAVSHELRTPLTVVKGLGDTLMTLGHRLDEETRQDVTRRLVDAAGRLDLLLSDLLDIQRLEQGIGIRADVVTPGMIEGYAVAAARDHGVAALEVDVVGRPPAVRCDPTLLSRGVANLVSNARKYAPGPVQVVIEGSDGGLCIRVEDHGPGVPPALRGEVFQPFARGSATDSATPGVGIGLSLVAGLASSADGRAWASAREDGRPGASFRIWLPAAEAPDQLLGPPGLHGRRLAVVGEDVHGPGGDQRGHGFPP